ncbi:MAG: ATPase, partial [Treponemataceae bacterium]|nr:ATPase [Treponemataceae bacterium]
RITANRNELERLSGWGSVVPEEIAALAEKGVYVSLYEIPLAKYHAIGADARTLLVNRDKAKARFLLIADSADADRPVGMPPEAYQVVLPQKSTAELTQEIADCQKQIAAIDAQVADSVQYVDSLKRYVPLLAKDIEFENIYSGMGYESKAAGDDEAALPQTSVPLAWVTGFVPVDDLATLQAAAKEANWGLAVGEPSEDEFVPTKLKNNRLVSVIYPLTDFLDVTPGYREFDISGWFLLFFCIFFAMIFGDACYGALITIAGLVALAKSKKGGRSLGVLVTLLGLCTMGWGVVTCSWFGIEPEKLPPLMKDISFAPFSAAKSGTDVANTNQKIFCFALALIQLSIAHLKCMVADRRSLKFFGDMGSLFMIWGMFYVVMNMVVDSVRFPLGITETTLFVYGFPLPCICLGVLG